MVGNIWGGDFEYNSIQEYFNIGIITFKNRDTADNSPPILNSCPVSKVPEYRYYIMIRHVKGSHYQVSGLYWNKPGVGPTIQMVFTKDDLPDMFIQVVKLVIIQIQFYKVKN